jgi:pyrroloquinoline quinone biosynthesis protein B
MKVHLLGTAAGGGFPQWNCNCAQCRGVRGGTLKASPRTQSSIAIAADGGCWFLVNASPDVRVQLQSLPGLLPPPDRIRGTGVEGIFLSNADLDHTLGLLCLREGDRLWVHATPAIQRSLREGLGLAPVLDRYSGLDFSEVPWSSRPLTTRSGRPTGLHVQALPVPGKLPRYREGHVEPSPEDNVAYLFTDDRTGGRLLYMPALGRLDERLLRLMEACDVLLLDGTFWDEQELVRLGVGSLSASEMGHLPISGPSGTLKQVSPLRTRRKIYVHINNTNPVLSVNSPEHGAILAAGMEIGQDSLEVAL